MADLRVLVALARAEQDRFARLAVGTAETAGRLWDRYGPVSDLTLAAWQAQTVPLVVAAQNVAAVQRIGYLTAYSNLSGVPTRAPAIDVAALVADARNGTPAATVYARPTITARKALSEGRTIDEALKVGRARLLSTVSDDVMLAARAAEHETMLSFPHVVGYRRVPNAGACKLCLAASTQRYHVRDLRPCHGNCRCSVAPIVGTEDPGHILNRDLHAQLKQQGVIDDLTARKRGDVRFGGPRSATERDLPRVAVHEHGELGPTLTNAGDHWTGPL
ncbi:MAG: hypothetical protein ABIP21_00220 [Acidimicrobiia bacterium]